MKDNKKFQNEKDCAPGKNGKSNTSKTRGNKKHSNNNNSNKGNSKYSNKKYGSEPSYDNGVNSNDINWYVKSAPLLESVGNFNFSNPIGTALPVDYSYPSTDDIIVSEGDLNVSGVMGIHVTKAPGIANRASDPLNVAARALYTFVRHQNSGAKNYESADLMMYILAMDEAYSYYAFLMRLYSTCLLYSQRNKYLPKALLHANGADESIANSMPELRTYINLYAQKLSTMCIPADIDLIKRHVWLFSNYWLDSPEIKAQTIAFIPTEFKHYAGYEDRNGGRLVSTPWFNPDTNPYHTIEDIKTFGDRIIYSIIEDEDMSIISGDILKAYGEGKLYTAPMVPSDSVVLPTYNPEILVQINHASIIPCTMNVTQEYGLISATATRTTTSDDSRIEVDDLVFNMPSASVNPADCMIATRLVVHTNIDGEIISCGSEIVNGLRLYTILRSGSIISNNIRSNIILIEKSGDGPEFPVELPMMDAYLRISKYDHFPILYVFEKVMLDEDSHSIGFIDIWNDLQNYTVVPMDRVDLLHLVALQGLFNIPDVAIRG